LPEQQTASPDLVRRIADEIVQPVVGMDLDIHDSILDATGTSLSLVQIAAEVQSVFDVEVSLIDLFDEPTVAALAAQVEELLAEEAEYT
jgi:acyl carrier protein